MSRGIRFLQTNLGTSAFTAAGWQASFYHAGMKPADYFTYYATQFDSVEGDSMFYRKPESGWLFE